MMRCGAIDLPIKQERFMSDEELDKRMKELRERNVKKLMEKRNSRKAPKQS